MTGLQVTELCQIPLGCRHIEETLGVQAGGTGGVYLREPAVLLRGVCFFQPIAVSFKAGAWHIETVLFFPFLFFFWVFFFCFSLFSFFRLFFFRHSISSTGCFWSHRSTLTQCCRGRQGSMRTRNPCGLSWDWLPHPDSWHGTEIRK